MKYKTDDGTKVTIDNRQFIDGVPVVDEIEFLERLRNIILNIKYYSKKTKNNIKKLTKK